MQNFGIMQHFVIYQANFKKKTEEIFSFDYEELGEIWRFFFSPHNFLCMYRWANDYNSVQLLFKRIQRLIFGLSILEQFQLKTLLVQLFSNFLHTFCFVSAVTSIVPTVLTIASQRWLFTSYGCSMQAFCLTYFGPLESSFIMLCALDRFSAIRSPLFYNQLEIYVLKFLKLIFVVGILVNLPIPITASVIAVTVQFNPQFSHCVYSFGGMWVVPLLNYVLQYIIPGLVIIFCYSYIAVAAFISKNKHLKTISTVSTVLSLS